MADAYRILLQDEDLGVAMCGPAFMTIIYGAPTVARIDKLADIQRKHMKNDRYAVITIIDPRVGRDIDSDARHRAKQVSNEMAPFTISMTFIVLGTGFFASMARSVIAGIQLITNQKAPWKVVADIDAGMAFVQESVALEQKQIDATALQACAARLIDGGPAQQQQGQAGAKGKNG